MNDSDGPLKHNPFSALERLLKDKPVRHSLPPLKPVSGPAEAFSSSGEEERAFRVAMEGVRRIGRDKRQAMKKKWTRPQDHLVNDPDQEVLQQLDNLVKYGQGFVISKTPEYMEGTGRNIPPDFAERLHRGDFSIQAHLDLHGLSVTQAKDAFDHFLQEVIRSDKRGVLIVHGRGISSSGEPVLKNKVSEWLSRSQWRKWVIAFTSAQSFDGGAGATYVLLRHHLKLKGPRKS